MSDYPRMLYHDDGRMAVAHDEGQEAELGAEWGREPSAVHRDETATVLHPPPSGPPSALEIRHIVREELAVLFDNFGPAPEPEPEAIPRRRGRPPGSRNQQPADTGEED